MLIDARRRNRRATPAATSALTPPPPFPSCTDWTRLVLLPVPIGHVSSLRQQRARGGGATEQHAERLQGLSGDAPADREEEGGGALSHRFASASNNFMLN
jgi:hypothetical protein